MQKDISKMNKNEYIDKFLEVKNFMEDSEETVELEKSLVNINATNELNIMNKYATYILMATKIVKEYNLSTSNGLKGLVSATITFLKNDLDFTDEKLGELEKEIVKSSTANLKIKR